MFLISIKNWFGPYYILIQAPYLRMRIKWSLFVPLFCIFVCVSHTSTMLWMKQEDSNRHLLLSPCELASQIYEGHYIIVNSQQIGMTVRNFILSHTFMLIPFINTLFSHDKIKRKQQCGTNKWMMSLLSWTTRTWSTLFFRFIVAPLLAWLICMTHLIYLLCIAGITVLLTGFSLVYVTYKIISALFTISIISVKIALDFLHCLSLLCVLLPFYSITGLVRKSAGSDSGNEKRSSKRKSTGRDGCPNNNRSQPHRSAKPDEGTGNDPNAAPPSKRGRKKLVHPDRECGSCLIWLQLGSEDQ